MSVAAATHPNALEGTLSYQPFQCPICLSRFTRHENLKRHAALHSRPQGEAPLSCIFCHATFSRPDLRHRHMKRKHPEYQDQKNTSHQDKRAKKYQARNRISDGKSPQEVKSPSASPAESANGSCLQQPGDELDPDSGIDLAINTPSSIEGEMAMEALAQQMSTSIHHISQGRINREPNLLIQASFLEMDTQTHTMPTSQSPPFDVNMAVFNISQGSPGRLSPNEWFPSILQVTQGCSLFFDHVSHFAPFMHHPTFDDAQVPNYLLLGMLCLAYQYGEDPDGEDRAGSGASLSVRCFHRARMLIAAEEEKTDCSIHRATVMVQTYLLLQIYAMMFLCGSDSAYGLKTHLNMISLARAGGLMQPISVEAAATTDLDSLWRQFIMSESHKRTLFAVHQVDTLWYQVLSIPRSLSHLEIKHDLPCPEDCWTASSSIEWAHRQLVTRQSGTSMQYSDAVRCFLSSEADLTSVPPFDPYGCINITQFLVSSAREISGWSTMTGMLSMERLEPLTKSLVALNPYIRASAEAVMTPHRALCEATWETAMIELQMWSPSHTSGIIEGSINGVLRHLTHSAPSCEFLCESNIAKSIQPHIDWFLRYLDKTIPDSEAPWITLYAYKAFMIAWQLVRGGMSESMKVVGVHDGDAEGALTWARDVFRRRQRWQLGRIIMSCLDELKT